MSCHFQGSELNLGKDILIEPKVTEFRQPLQVMSHLEMSGILAQQGHIQRT